MHRRERVFTSYPIAEEWEGFLCLLIGVRSLPTLKE
jgi:hypothetical protein